MTAPNEAPATTRDAFYGGRLVLAQPLKGHRSGTDAVLLAAAAPAGFSGTCYDMGSGVGAVGLGVALLRPGTTVVLVERDPVATALAWANAATLERAAVSVAQCDLLERPALRRALPEHADLVVTNPPFHDANSARPSPDPRRRAAHMLDYGAGLGDWLAACLDRLRDRGTLLAIVSVPTLPAVLAALDGPAGSITIKPIHPRPEKPAHRLVVRAVKTSKAPLALAAPLVLHDGNGRFTEEVERLHRGEAALDW